MNPSLMLKVAITLLSLVVAAPVLPAQSTGSYTLYGNGCSGSAAAPGPVLPTGFATQYGGRGNAFPWGWYNQHYMQGHDAKELPVTAVIRGLAFRNRQNYAQNAYTLDMTVRVGFTNNGARALSSTFASNWVGTPQVVFTGKLNVPAVARSTSPALFTMRVPFASPFVYSQSRGNFLWETINTTAARPNTNYFDAATGSGLQVSRIFATGSAATVGTLGVGYGVVTQLIGPGGGAIVQLTNTGVPRINQSFDVHVSGAVANSVALLWLGAQKLNISLSPILPGCSLYTSLDVLLGGVSTGSGSATSRFTLPNTRSLIGIRFFNQWMVVDRAANNLGIVLSNGGEAVIGS